jgi:UPF0271 protein
MGLSGPELTEETYRQLAYLGGLAKAAGVELVHVKPHGALYHEISGKEAVAEAFCEGVARFSRGLVIVGFAGSRGLQVAAGRGFCVAAEAFMDRAYEADGTLRARSVPGAMIIDVGRALAQAREIVKQGRVRTADGRMIELRAETLCVHSDTPGAAGMAEAVAAGLRGAGVEIRGFGK